jgi:hypothetical protein
MANYKMKYSILITLFSLAESASRFTWFFHQPNQNIQALNLGIKEIEREERKIQAEIDQIVKNDAYVTIFKCQYFKGRFKDSTSEEKYINYLKKKSEPPYSFDSNVHCTDFRQEVYDFRERQAKELKPIQPKWFFQQPTIEEKKTEYTNKIISKKSKKKELKFVRKEHERLKQSFREYEYLIGNK